MLRANSSSLTSAPSSQVRSMVPGAVGFATLKGKIDAVRLEYGGNKRPYVYNPAASLREVNNQHYGGPGMYDFLIFDFAKENPARDAILMQGVTELQSVVTIGSGVTVSGGQVHLVQETLF